MISQAARGRQAEKVDLDPLLNGDEQTGDAKL